MSSTDVAVRDPELDRFARLGRWLALSESKSDSPETRGAAGALRFYYAQALGLPPLAAAEISVIDGKLVASALLLRGLAAQQGFEVRQVSGDDTACTAAIYKGDRELGRSTFTIEDAKRAGLAKRINWQNYPQRMLWARASANVIRDYASQVAVGILTREELADQDGGDPVEAPAVEVTVEDLPDWPAMDQTEQYDAEQETFDDELGETGDPPDNDGDDDGDE